jgi:hypothetical protein
MTLPPDTIPNGPPSGVGRDTWPPDEECYDDVTRLNMVCVTALADTHLDAMACTEHAAEAALDAGMSRATWMALCEQAWREVTSERCAQ